LHHLKNTLQSQRNSLKRLSRFLKRSAKKPQAKKCAAMQGILDEAGETMDETEGVVRDAGIILSAQKVEHL